MTSREVAGAVWSLNSEAVFHWSVTIHPDNDLYQSPTLYSTDNSGVDHEWRLQLDMMVHRSGPATFDNYEDNAQRMGDEDDDFMAHKILKITLQYAGNGMVSVYFISFRVIDKGCSRDLYNDSNESSLGQISRPKIFSKRDQSYVVALATTGLRSSSHELEIVCRVYSDTNTGCIQLVRGAINHHDLTLKNEFEALFESGELSDVTFVVGNQELHLHKGVLSTRSAVFSAMFKHDVKENDCNRVYIEDLSFATMKELFRYIYAAHVNDVEDYTAELLVASDKYAVDGLKILCEEQLIKSLTPENVISCMLLAHYHNAKDLEVECMDFFTSNAKKIVEEPFYDLTRLPGEVVNKLYKALAVKSEVK